MTGTASPRSGHVDRIEERARTGRGEDTSSWLHRSSVWPVAVLTGCFALSRVTAAIYGLRFSNATLSGNASDGLWQLLDLRLLRNHLVESVWHINSQPPLFNLYAGMAL